MFENLKQIELLNCHIKTLHRALILTKPITGNSHQIYFNQQNALGTHSERAGGILYVHRCIKVIVHVVENQFSFPMYPNALELQNGSWITCGN